MALKTQILPARLNTTGANGLNANASLSSPVPEQLNHILVISTGMAARTPHLF
jgi:hypothetical protein